MADRAKLPDSLSGSAPRVLGSWTRVLLDALNENGFDGSAIAQKAGFAIDEFTDPNAQFSLDRTSIFWRLAVQETGDDAIGIWVSKSIKLTTFHALGLAVAASRSFHEALLRMERYCDIVSDSEKVKITVMKGHWEYQLLPGALTYRASPESLDAIMSHMIRSSRATIQGFSKPVSVSLARPKPTNHNAFSEFYNCPITYDTKINVIRLPLDLMEAPLMTANVGLADASDQILNTVLNQNKADPLDDKICQIMVEALPSGHMTLDEVASGVGQSVRTLQRHLSAKGTTFSGLLSDLRTDLARNYLRQTKLPVTEIAFLLGYADTTSFSRAFKTWTGQTPREFQQTDR